MKKKLVALAMATAVTAAVADGIDNGAYVGAGMGFSTLTNIKGGVSQPGLGLYAGYDLADWMQVEGSFYSASFSPIGKSSYDYQEVGNNVSRVGIFTNNGSINTLALSGKFDWWWVDSFGVYAKLGIGLQYNSYNNTYYPLVGPQANKPQAIGNNSGFEPALLGGIGAQWNIGKVGLRIEDVYQLASHDNQAPANGLGSSNTYGFIIQYHF